MQIEPEIVMTGDGSHTMRHPVLGELYHSANGAVAESTHVFIRNGLHWFLGMDNENIEDGDAGRLHLCQHPVRIMEVGLGSGLNSLLTLQEAERTGIAVEYTAIELYPVAPASALKLSYASEPAFMQIHDCPWEVPAEIMPRFTLLKRHADLAVTEFDAIFDLVYFDAFAPDCQPQLWTAELLGRIFESMSQGGALLTYSAKGDVKRALRQAGFSVHRLPGAPGKRHMIRAVKP